MLLSVALLCLTACGGATEPQITTEATLTATTTVTEASTNETTSTTSTTSAEPTESLQTDATTAPSGAAELYIAFDLEEPDTYELPYTGTLDAAMLLQGLAGLTGWNCDVNKIEILSDTARVDLAETSLPFTYDGQRPNETFFLSTYADTVFLFLDSINQTLTKNLGLSGVIFTQNEGEPLHLERLYSSVELFPADTLYRGSAYYRALLQDDPYSNLNGYPMIQLEGGMTLLYPNGFNIDGETDTEFRVSAEDQVFITYCSYPLEVEDTTGRNRTPEQMAEAQALESVTAWRAYMSEVSEETYSAAGYEIHGKVGAYNYHVTGFMAPVKSAYYEVRILYEDDVSFVDMETIIRDLSYALSKYN